MNVAIDPPPIPQKGWASAAPTSPQRPGRSVPARDPATVVRNVLKWRKTEVFGAVAIAVLLAAIVVVGTPASYTSTAELLIETRRARTAPGGDQQGAEAPIDNAVLESQVELLKSDTVTRAVLDKLGMWNDPDLLAPDGPGSLFLDTIPSLSLTNTAEAKGVSEAAAIGAFQKRLSIARQGRSYVTEIAFRSQNPEKAARVVNAIAAAYVEDTFSARAEAAERTGEWLLGRIAFLRDKAAEAARAVETFKSANNLMIDAEGRVASDRELAELSKTLAATRAATSEARGKLEATRKVLAARNAPSSPATGGAAPDSGSTEPPLVVPEELTSPLITPLRTQYLDLVRQRSDWIARSGADHPAAKNIAAEMQRVRGVIFEEVSRMASALQSDVAIAEARERSAEARIEELFKQGAEGRRALVKLRELEAQAQVFKALHENTLTRHAATLDQQSFPVTDARVISSAMPPASKSAPRTSVTLLLAAFAGGIAGLGFAARREALRPRLRETSDIETELSLPELGRLPSIAGRSLLPMRQAAPLLMRDRADTLRRTRLAVSDRCAEYNGCIAAITSAAAGTGKTTVAYNLAAVAAEDGVRALLIDANLRNPTLTRGIKGSATALGDVLAGNLDIEDAAEKTRAGFDLLGGVPSRAGAHPLTTLRRVEFGLMLARARTQYDLVVIDLPAALGCVDVQAVIRSADALVIVAEWGVTASSDVARVLQISDAMAERAVGVIVNKVPRRYT